MVDLRARSVFLDVCTQHDYLSPAGAAPSINAPQASRHIKRLVAFARWAKLPIVSCVDVRRVDEVRGLPNPTCVLGTAGQRKVGFTLLPTRVLIDSDNCLCVPMDVLDRHQQAILTKSHRDPFTNPKLDRLLTELPSTRFVVMGVSLECSIRLLILGLILRQRRVALVSDACGYWNESEAEMTLRQLEAKGCELVTTQDLINQELLPLRRRPLRRFRDRRSVA